MRVSLSSWPVDCSAVCGTIWFILWWVVRVGGAQIGQQGALLESKKGAVSARSVEWASNASDGLMKPVFLCASVRACWDSHPVVCYVSHHAELSARQGCLTPLNRNGLHCCFARFLWVYGLDRTVNTTLQYSPPAMMKIADDRMRVPARVRAEQSEQCLFRSSDSKPSWMWLLCWVISKHREGHVTSAHAQILGYMSGGLSVWNYSKFKLSLEAKFGHILL